MGDAALHERHDGLGAAAEDDAGADCGVDHDVRREVAPVIAPHATMARYERANGGGARAAADLVEDVGAGKVDDTQAGGVHPLAKINVLEAPEVALVERTDPGQRGSRCEETGAGD